MKKKLDKALLVVSLLSFALLAASITAIGTLPTDEYDVILEPHNGFMCASAFWLSLIIGVLSQIILSLDVKRWCKQSKSRRQSFRQMKVGLLNIFSNTPAAISDIAAALSLISCIITILAKLELPIYLSISALVFSFSAHCIFNGKNYYYVFVKEHEHIHKKQEKKEEV